MNMYSTQKKTLTRSVHNRQIGGVCSGLARYLEVNATVVRVLYVLLSICTAFSGVLIYLILWALVPQEEHY